MSDLERAKELVDLAEEDASSAKSEVSEMVDLLDSDDGEARNLAAEALSHIGEEHPEELEPFEEKLKDLKQNESSEDVIRKIERLLLVIIKAKKNSVFDKVNESLKFAGEEGGKYVGSTLGQIAKKRPDLVEPYLEDIVELLDDDQVENRVKAVEAIGSFVDIETSLRGTYLDVLAGALDDDSSSVRSKAISTFLNIVRDNCKIVKSYAEDVSELLDDKVADIRYQSTTILLHIGLNYPEKVKPFVDRIAELLDDRYEEFRGEAASALRPIAEEFPEAVEPYIEDIAALLYREEAEGQIPVDVDISRPDFVSNFSSMFAPGSAGRTLSRFAEKYPERIDPHMDKMAKLLDHEDGMVRSKFVGVMETIGKENPEMIAPYTDDIAELLHGNQKSGCKDAVVALFHISEVNPEKIKPYEDDLEKLKDESRYRSKRIFSDLTLQEINSTEK